MQGTPEVSPQGQSAYFGSTRRARLFLEVVVSSSFFDYVARDIESPLHLPIIFLPAKLADCFIF
jgi:hypothetical protein